MQKGVYPCEYMDDWEFDETSLPEKEYFYRYLNMKDITDADYTDTKNHPNIVQKSPIILIQVISGTFNSQGLKSKF